MVYLLMTSISVVYWSVVCFSIYLLLSCDGGMVVRWMIGLMVIGLYRPILRMIYMTIDEWKSFFLTLAGVLLATVALFICTYLVLR